MLRVSWVSCSVPACRGGLATYLLFQRCINKQWRFQLETENLKSGI